MRIAHNGHVEQGCKEPRLDGEEHMAAVEEFCFAAQKQFPNCLIQFEDFPTDKVPSATNLHCQAPHARRLVFGTQSNGVRVVSAQYVGCGANCLSRSRAA